MEIPGPGLKLGQAYRCGGVTPVNVIPTLIIGNKQTIKKPAHISVNSIRSHTITKK